MSYKLKQISKSEILYTMILLTCITFKDTQGFGSFNRNYLLQGLCLQQPRKLHLFFCVGKEWQCVRC